MSLVVVNTHDEITASLTALYTLLVKIGYLAQSEISWPPHAESELNRPYCRKFGLDDSATGLLEKIPWPIPFAQLIYESQAVHYGCDGDIEDSRDPANQLVAVSEPEEFPTKLDAWMVPLTFSTPRRGNTLLIDSRNGTIRELEAATIPSGAFPRGHYANWDTKPTTEVINKIYHEYNTLKYIPLRGIENDGGSLGEGDMVYTDIKRKMIEEYGWPDNFRTDCWRNDIHKFLEQWQEEAEERLEKAGEITEGVRKL